MTTAQQTETTTLIVERQALEAERQALAREVALGRPGTSEKLDRVLERIEALGRLEARRALVAEAEQDLVREQAEREQAQRRTEARAAFEGQKAEVRALAARLDELAEALADSLRDFAERAHDLERHAGAIGERYVRTQRLTSAAAGSLAWHLSAVPFLVHAFARPIPPYREALTTLLQGVLAPAASAAPEEPSA
jgi:DNA-binding ferritin-like protein